MSHRVVIFKDIEKKYFNMTKLSLNYNENKFSDKI